MDAPQSSEGELFALPRWGDSHIEVALLPINSCPTVLKQFWLLNERLGSGSTCKSGASSLQTNFAVLFPSLSDPYLIMKTTPRIGTFSHGSAEGIPEHGRQAGHEEGRNDAGAFAWMAWGLSGCRRTNRP